MAKIDFSDQLWQSIDENLHSYSFEDQHHIQKAIAFMTRYLSRNCTNTKPVILHSIRVGLRLQMLGYPVETVITGYLHDTVEDSNCHLEDIAREFKPEIAKLVAACTFDSTIADYKKRWHKSAANLVQAGQKAMIIKMIDALDNHHYYPKLLDPIKQAQYLWKMDLLIKTFEPHLADDPLFQYFKTHISRY